MDLNMRGNSSSITMFIDKKTFGHGSASIYRKNQGQPPKISLKFGLGNH